MNSDAWITHRATLARELDDEGWIAVRSAYDALAAHFGPNDAWVEEAYQRGQAALEPIMTSKRRYWWQRLRR